MYLENKLKLTFLLHWSQQTEVTNKFSSHRNSGNGAKTSRPVWNLCSGSARLRVRSHLCTVVGLLCRPRATGTMCGVYPGPRVPSTYTLHDCTCSTSRSTTRTVRMQCLFVVDRLIGTMIMYNEFCHMCNRTTRIPVTSGFQEKIRFCGICPLDRRIAGVDAISRDGWEVC